VTTHHPILGAIKGRKIRPAQKAIRDHFNLATAVIGQGYWERNTQKKKAKGKQS
jgi:DNA-binding GntR family transcriptional regulator